MHCQPSVSNFSIAYGNREANQGLLPCWVKAPSHLVGRRTRDNYVVVLTAAEGERGGWLFLGWSWG